MELHVAKLSRLGSSPVLFMSRTPQRAMDDELKNGSLRAGARVGICMSSRLGDYSSNEHEGTLIFMTCISPPTVATLRACVS